MTVVAVAVFGAVGALARYGVSGVVQRRWRTAFPVGTLVVNLTGAFVAGILLGLAVDGAAPDLVAIAAGTGFLGGYTTFSTWMVETVLAAETGGRSGIRRAGANLALPLVGGLIVVAVGFALGAAL
ncbi:MAG: CrcB family protein [Actinomycetota bacterium]